jgi:hypothetical protein
VSTPGGVIITGPGPNKAQDVPPCWDACRSTHEQNVGGMQGQQHTMRPNPGVLSRYATKQNCKLSRCYSTTHPQHVPGLEAGPMHPAYQYIHSTVNAARLVCSRRTPPPCLTCQRWMPGTHMPALCLPCPPCDPQVWLHTPPAPSWPHLQGPIWTCLQAQGRSGVAVRGMEAEAVGLSAHA